MYIDKSKIYEVDLISKAFISIMRSTCSNKWFLGQYFSHLESILHQAYLVGLTNFATSSASCVFSS